MSSEKTVGSQGMTSAEIRASSKVESVEVSIRRKGCTQKFTMVGPRLGDQLRKIAEEVDGGNIRGHKVITTPFGPITVRYDDRIPEGYIGIVHEDTTLQLP